jgi:hypothetical protein
VLTHLGLLHPAWRRSGTYEFPLRRLKSISQASQEVNGGNGGFSHNAGLYQRALPAVLHDIGVINCRLQQLPQALVLLSRCEEVHDSV